MKRTWIAAGVAGLALTPASAEAHISFHPNAIPAGSFPTLNIRVPNEQDNANITSVRMKMPDGVLSALGAPPAGWKFNAKTKKLAKPVKTDDGTITTEVTEVDFTGGNTPPGEFADFKIAMSIPDSAKQGAVLSFPTIQSYSNGKAVRWIGKPDDEDTPAPSLDITKDGTALLDVTGGDAGPPAKLPTDLAGQSSSSSAAAAPAAPAIKTVIKKEQSKGLGIAALIIAIIAAALAAGALARRRTT